MTTAEHLLKQGFRPMLIGRDLCYGKRFGARSLRIYLHEGHVTLRLMQRKDGVVSEVKAMTVATSRLTTAIRLQHHF